MHQISAKSFLYACLAIQIVSIVQCAPTKEVELESDLTVKSRPSEVDLDQFHKDQAHLAEEKGDGQGTTGGISSIEIPMIGTIGSLPFFGELNELLEIASSLSPIGMLSQDFILLVQVPLEFFMDVLDAIETGLNKTDEPVREH